MEPSVPPPPGVLLGRPGPQVEGEGGGRGSPGAYRSAAMVASSSSLAVPQRIPRAASASTLALTASPELSASLTSPSKNTSWPFLPLLVKINDNDRVISEPWEEEEKRLVSKLMQGGS